MPDQPPAAAIRAAIARIDRAVSAQVSAVLHHPAFQRLEGTWRGLWHLVGRLPTGGPVRVKVLNLTRRDLQREADRAGGFDQTELFRLIYEEEYGRLGGEPYGLLVGDFAFGRSADDLAVLGLVSQVGAAAHAPFVAAAAPELFAAERFADLLAARDLGRVFEADTHAGWRRFRQAVDSRYVALALPRVLGRPPYPPYAKGVTGFLFTEAPGGPGDDRRLWVSPGWVYAALAAEAFARDGWFMRTRGVLGGGAADPPAVDVFPTDTGEVAVKCPAEVALPDARECELGDLGFLPVVADKNRRYLAFLGAQSVHQPARYADPLAAASAALSAKLGYTLSVSRFAHCMKVMARNRLGSDQSAEECGRFLGDWLRGYVVGNPAGVSDEVRARKPLAAAEVRVVPAPGKPGWYQAVAYLQPHYQMDAVAAAVRLVAELPLRA